MGNLFLFHDHCKYPTSFSGRKYPWRITRNMTPGDTPTRTPGCRPTTSIRWRQRGLCLMRTGISVWALSERRMCGGRIPARRFFAAQGMTSIASLPTLVPSQDEHISSLKFGVRKDIDRNSHNSGIELRATACLDLPYGFFHRHCFAVDAAGTHCFIGVHH
jgi:hypothetical protein